MAMALLSSVIFLIKSVFTGLEIPFYAILWVKTVIWLFWGLWVPLIFFLIKNIPIQKKDSYKGLFFHIPISIVIVALHLLLYALVVKLSSIPGMRNLPIETLFINFMYSQFEWYFMTYWALILGSYAFKYYDEVQEGKLESAQLETMLTKSRLQVLKAQIRPHFLFNTLNTISSLVRQSKKERSLSMLSELSDMLRLVLDQREKQYVILSEEVTFIKKYIALEEKRFKNKINAKIMFNKEIENALIPSFILQPLIENSIYHGLSKKIDATLLSLTIEKIEGKLYFTLFNEGFPLPKGFHVSKTKGIGLANTIERLSRLYHNKYDFKIFNSDKGVTTVLTIPYKTSI